jgi:hypothetical protein
MKLVRSGLVLPREHSKAVAHGAFTRIHHLHFLEKKKRKHINCFLILD